jgi:PEGA domain-containing protein
MPRYRKTTLCVFLTLVLVVVAQGKERAPQVIVWPPSGQPVVRFSLGKFKQVSSSGNQHNYTVDITAENLWGKAISRANFSLYLFDKTKTRIGEGWISLSDVAPGEVVKFQMGAQASGTPDSFALAPQSLPSELQSYLPPKTISVTVNSVPQGAELKVDGTKAGTTPKVIQVAPGKHMLEFSKEGFQTGHFPLEVTPDDASGGSVSYELGSSAHDTVELRDGSVLSGDVESMSATEVLVRIGGTVQHLDRNQVKRIALVPREAPPQ